MPVWQVWCMEEGPQAPPVALREAEWVVTLHPAGPTLAPIVRPNFGSGGGLVGIWTTPPSLSPQGRL